MTATNKQTKQEKAMEEHVTRTQNALESIDMPEAAALQLEINQKKMTYNHAKTGLEKADEAKKEESKLEQAETELQAVLTTTYFSVREYDHAHFAKLPAETDFEDLEPDFIAAQLLPVLQEGGKDSQLMGHWVERAVERKAQAQERVRKAGEHDRKAGDKWVAARKDLGSVLMKAEAFIHLHTPSDHAARGHLKRPKVPKAPKTVKKGADSPSSTPPTTPG